MERTGPRSRSTQICTPLLLLLMLTLFLWPGRSGLACTGIRLKAEDGSIIYARTMEFAVDLKSNVIVVPRGLSYAGTAPGGRRGLEWTTKYGTVGANAFGLPLVVDGLNERGLAAGLFYFPGYARYQHVAESEIDEALGPHELATFLLGTCATVDEAVEAAKRVKVGESALKEFGSVPPIHAIVHDKQGRCVVLEYVDGALHIHDNPLGVVTNSPTFDWHVTNLRNYVNLSVTNVPPVSLSGIKLAAFGQGTGMLGLPGDFTPPSRFVRAVAFTTSSKPVAQARDGVHQAFHILNQFDIPKGSTRENARNEAPVDYTLWTSASDLENLRYHFHTFGNRRIRMVDLKKMDLSAGALKSISMSGDEVIEDVGDQAR